jgi:hypothetical protein
MRVEGRVLHRGVPQAGCQVLLVDEAARAVTAAAATGDDGGWALDGEGSLVFARCRGEALGVVAAPVGGPLDLEIADVAPTYELTLNVVGPSEGLTPQIRLTPREISGVDLRWLRAPIAGARASTLASVTARGLVRWVQAGRWWITAAVLMEASGGVPVPDSWLPIAAEAEGGSLEPDGDGFALDVHGPATVTIRLEARPTEVLDR